MRRSIRILQHDSRRNSSDASHLDIKVSDLKLPPINESTIAAHFLTLEQLAKIFNTDFDNGITKERANELLSIQGPNAIQHKNEHVLLKIFSQNFFGWFPLMLWVGGLLSIAIHFLQYLKLNDDSNENLYLGIIIITVILFTGILGFYQEAKNIRVMKGFKKLMPQTAQVIRNGDQTILPSKDLVEGDVVVMNLGELVPADIRLVMVNNFKIDMSSITGESAPQLRTIHFTDENPLESKNLAFSSCLITEGNAKGVVVATGKNTVIGRIAGLVTSLQKEESPIATEIKYFIKVLSILAIITGIFFFFMVSFIQKSWMAGFYYMIGIIVANVPEGLLVTLTVSLTLTAKKLRKKNCVVKKLQSVETLGAISVICSDKTGTLTENRMSVSHITFDMKNFEHDDETMKKNPVFNELTFAASLCMKAEFEEQDDVLPNNECKIKGDATETAILKYLGRDRLVTVTREANPKVCDIPFNSRSKYQLTINHMLLENKFMIIMKGAPEVIFKFCDTIMLSTGEIKITTEEKDRVRHLCAELGHMGERVLGYCNLILPPEIYTKDYKFDHEDMNFPIDGYCFLGMISLVDPPRASVPYSIAKCRSAGIKVIMVTGDHPITALSISRKVGIISPENETIYDEAFKKGIDPKQLKKDKRAFIYRAAVITGEELRMMSADTLDKFINEMDELTFARTSPRQKMLIVEACQRAGHVVAVTGDGVNDAPALKKADIGISMGITGTDVSKEAADMILLDDDFSSIVSGIEEGRLIFDNLKKSIAFTLTSNTPEMIPFVLYATIGIPLPLHALLIICINVFTDLWPAISLAYENPETDIMKKPPRDLSSDRLVNSKLIAMAYLQVGILQTLAGLSGFFITLALFGFLPQDLLFVRERWNSASINDYVDSFGQEWTYAERKYLEKLAQSTYYVSIVTVQIADILICKTRRLSLIDQGMSNHMLNAGIMIEIFVSFIIIYIPFFNEVLYTAPVPWQLWLPAVPYAIFLIIADEFRRYFIRKYPGGWMERETYF